MVCKVLNSSLAVLKMENTYLWLCIIETDLEILYVSSYIFSPSPPPPGRNLW